MEQIGICFEQICGVEQKLLQVGVLFRHALQVRLGNSYLLFWRYYLI